MTDFKDPFSDASYRIVEMENRDFVLQVKYNYQVMIGSQEKKWLELFRSKDLGGK